MTARASAPVRSRARLRAAVLLAASLGVLLGGCGARSQPGAAPAAMTPAQSPGGPQAEIARLWDEIDAWRGQAGVSAPSDVRSGYAEEPMAEAAEVPDGNGASEATTSAQGPRGMDLGQMAAAIRPPDATCPAAESEPPACRDSCTLTTSICDNARRICGLAEDLAGDDWAAGKCADATAVCRQATAACCDCRAGT
jgi:hypothetical protein